MILKEDVGKLISLLEKREVKLYHACQFTDFMAYLEIGGIPSRKKLEDSKKFFTAFETDSSDHDNGVWDKVFVNLQDFGLTFARGKGATPNTYGPILLIVSPLALTNAEDTAITLRSAGAKDFNREKESLSTLDEVNSLFIHSMKARYPKSTYIKMKKDLQKDFAFPKAASPEVNCTFSEGIIPLKYIQYIVTDPYQFCGIPFEKILSDLASERKLNFQIIERTCSYAERKCLYQELLEILTKKTFSSLAELAKNERRSPELQKWIGQLQGFDLDWQFARFAKYLREGTISPVLSKMNC